MGIDVVVATDNGYEQHTAVMLASLFSNNKHLDFKIHLLHSEKVQQLKRLTKFIKSKGHEYRTYEIKESSLSGFKVTHHVSLATYFRLLIPVLLPQECKRILYLDSDIVVLTPIDELWLAGEYNYGAAVAEDSFDRYKQLDIAPGSKYFNAGIMLWNVEKLRAINFTERAIKYMHDNLENIVFWDQDVINYMMQGNITEIEKSWNVFPADKESIRKKSKIFHFAGSVKPWNHPQHNKQDKLYFKYLLKTPWGYKCFTKRAYFSFLVKCIYKTN